MLRLISNRLATTLSRAAANSHGTTAPAVSGARLMSSHGPKESDEEFDARYVAYFSRPDIDSWELRKGMNDLHGMDLVPEPKIICAALRACRKLNDYALSVRYLESIQLKCKPNKDLWPYVLQEIKPTLEELGVNVPSELGYDKPELALKSVFDMHG